MGAGASSQQELEAMLTCTFLLGQALHRAFPDIYSLNDFDVHPDKKVRLIQEKKKQMKMEKQGKSASFTAMVLGADGVLRPFTFGADQSNAKAIEGNKESDTSNASEKEEEDEEIPDEDVQIDFPDVPLEDCLLLRYQDHDIAIPLADIEKPNQDGWTPLHSACHQHAAVDCAKAIIDRIKNKDALNAKTIRGPGSFVSDCTPLHLASAYGIAETVTNLVQAGADVEVTNSIGWSPLFEGVHRGYVDVVEALINAGAQTESAVPPCYASPQHAQYPLAHACRQGHIDVVKLFLNNPEIAKNKDRQNEYGWSALHEAAFYNRVEVVKLLLVYGCDVNLKTTKGMRAAELTLSTEIRDCLLDLMSEEDKEAILKAGMFGSVLGSGKMGTIEDKQLTEEGESEQVKEARVKRMQHKMKHQKVKESKLADAEEKSVPASEDTPIDNESNGESKSSTDEDSPAIDENVAPEYRLLGNLPGLPGAPGTKKTKKKRRKSKSNRKGVAPPEKGVPGDFCCALSGKLMVDPVKPPFGDVHYEKENIEKWLKSQGNMDPVTGMPLATCELVEDHDLRIEINDWQLQQSLKTTENPTTAGNVPEDEESMYEF